MQNEECGTGRVCSPGASSERWARSQKRLIEKWGLRSHRHRPTPPAAYKTAAPPRRGPLSENWRAARGVMQCPCSDDLEIELGSPNGRCYPQGNGAAEQL